MTTQKNTGKGNKVEKFATPKQFAAEMTRKFKAAEKQAKASKKNTAPVTVTETAPVIEATPVVAPVPVVTAPKATKEPKVTTPKIPKIPARHPNLPPIGTPIITHWKKMECAAVEQADGTFTVSLAGKTLGTFKTLSEGATAIIKTANPESTWEPSSFGWWELRTPRAPKADPAPESK